MRVRYPKLSEQSANHRTSATLHHSVADVNVSNDKKPSLKFSKTFLVLLSIFSLNALASTQDEIRHLLHFVASTGCEYERNGAMHNGTEAASHINRKYKYYSDEIESTEDFIKYSATKSKFTGKHYKIRCGSEPIIRSKDWLLKELKRYRNLGKQ